MEHHLENGETVECIELLDSYIEKNPSDIIYDINYESVTSGRTILMEAVVHNEVKFIHYILKNCSKEINIEYKSKKLKKTAMDISNELSFYHISDILRLADLGIDLQEKLREYETKNERVNGQNIQHSFHQITNPLHVDKDVR